MTSAYEDLARTYMRFVRQFSPRAGAKLEELYHKRGAYATYRAALLLADLRARYIRTGDHHPLPEQVNYFLQEFPRTRGLFEQALAGFAEDMFAPSESEAPASKAYNGKSGRGEAARTS